MAVFVEVVACDGVASSGVPEDVVVDLGDLVGGVVGAGLGGEVGNLVYGGGEDAGS